MFLTLTLNVGCVFLMMVPGFVCRRKGWLDDNSVLSISKVMLFFFYPCLIFSSITKNYSLAELGDSLWLPIGSGLIMLAGFAIGIIYCLFDKKISGEMRRSFVFQCTMNNYSFFPLAIILSMYGDGLVAALILSTLGAELVMWTVGMLTISGHKPGKSSVAALRSPPLLGMYASLAALVVMHVYGIDRAIFTERGSVAFYIHSTLERVGMGTVPIAMTIAGARMAVLKFEDIHNKLIYILSVLRLAVIPLAAIGLVYLLPISNDAKTILVIVAVMPVSMNSLLLNELYGGNRELITGSVLLTHVLSIGTIPILLYFFLENV